MSDQVHIVNPINSPNWDRNILATGKASFFHSAAWAATLAETYKFKPCFFILLNDDRKIQALMPLMEVQSFITGKRGVSLPFSDYCEPILERDADAATLLSGISDYGKKRGWKYLELRPGKKMPDNQLPSHTFLGHSLDLSPGEKALLGTFRERTRRNIKKAEAAGVVCTSSTSFHALEQFYGLNCLTRKRHGIPPQPFSFFKNVYKHIISQDKGVVILASHQGKVIAAAVYFHFGQEAMYKYGASSSDDLKLRGNYLVMWQAIRRYSQQGYKSLDMGRTDPENKGLDQFKTGWSVSTKELVYYKYGLRKALVVPLEEKSPSMREKIMRQLPIPLLRMIGSVAYRHVA